jgi:hypothetical protein
MQGALEMPRDQLLDVGLIGVLPRYPIAELLVEFRTLPLREAPVCGLEDEGVREAPTTTGLVLRLHETAPVQGSDRRLHVVGLHLRGERAHGRRSESAALDGRPFEDEAWHGIEAVEPRRDECLQRLGDLEGGVLRTHPRAIDEEPLVLQHRRELLQVQGIPLGRLANPIHDGRRGPVPEQDLGDPPSVRR